MAIDKSVQQAFDDGKAEANYIRDNQLSYALSGGIRSRPDDQDLAAAYDKGFADEQLDGDKGAKSDE